MLVILKSVGDKVEGRTADVTDMPLRRKYKVFNLISFIYLCKDVTADMRVFSNTVRTFALLLAALLMMQGCAKMKQIRIVSCDVESVSMHGMRGLSAVLSAGVDNPAATLELSDIEGTLYAGNDVLGSFSAGSLTLAGRSVSENSVPVDFTLDRSVSFMEIVSLLRNLDLEGITMDISFRAKIKGGVARKMKFVRIPVSRLASGSDIMDSLSGIRNFFIL